MWIVSRILKSFQRNKMQQSDPVQWGVWIYLHRAYFTAEILPSFTPPEGFLTLFSNIDWRRPLSHPNSTCFPETLLSPPCNKPDYNFPPLRDTAFKNLDLCEHSMGLFHSSKWPMNTCLENGYYHYTVFLLRKEKLCLLRQQWRKLGMWFTKHFVSSAQALQ